MRMIKSTDIRPNELYLQGEVGDIDVRLEGYSVIRLKVSSSLINSTSFHEKISNDGVVYIVARSTDLDRAKDLGVDFRKEVIIKCVLEYEEGTGISRPFPLLMLFMVGITNYI